MGARDKFRVRQDPRWPDAHVRLQRLWKERRPQGITQEQFGAEYDLGSQGMVWQYLNGYTPLNFEAAAKFAQGLRCTIKDISPDMDRVMRKQLLPALGISAWGKLLMALLIAMPILGPAPSDASTLHNSNYARDLTLIHLMRRWLRILQNALKFSQISDSPTPRTPKIGVPGRWKHVTLRTM